MKTRINEFVGVGIYTIPEAARILGVRAGKVRRWASEDSNGCGVIERSFPDEGILTFAELMELHFIRMFRAEGVSLQTIRKASDTAAKLFHTDHPFAMKRFDTDGRNIFATLTAKETNEEIVADLRKGQLVFQKIIKPFFKKLEYRGSESPIRYWPLEKSGRIVLDPERRFGHPIDAESGVPVDAILSELQAGGGQEGPTVAKWLDIPLEAVQAAIQFQKSLVS